jgi:outer membrane protein OmpA-like peptidoglycan-associated protein
MASKKYILLAILAVTLQVTAFAQGNDWGWDWKDSSKIPAKRMPQHNEFLNNNYPYPAQPRSQWELGFAGGASMIIGDVKSKVGVGGGISLRKALNHVLSIRGQYVGSFNSGSPSSYGLLVGQKEYKTKTHSGNLDVIMSLNTLSNYRGNPKTNVYVFGGYSLIASQVTQKSVAGVENVFYGQGIGNSQAGLLATFWGKEVNKRKGWSLMQGFSAGAGIAFKINNKVNLGLEQRLTFVSPGYDYSDGFAAGNSNDFYSFTSARINVNIGNSAKRVQPLYWINPNNFIYSELNKPQHMKMPKVKLDDADGDGVTDQFDLEPNTPAGAKVDTHGRAVDTDGDGVPDYKDKEILTPQKWFPVNNDGVGTAPEPSCCKELRDELAKVKEDIANGIVKNKCTIADLPSVQFKAGSSKLTKDAEALLATVAQKINANPTCKVKVVGYGSADKKAQQSSWEKVNAVIKYLVEKQGIAESRFIFTYGQEGDVNTVDLTGTTEEGPNTVPAPHPNLKGKK